MNQIGQYPRRLTEKEMERNRLLCVIEGGSARIIFNLTSGAFLVGFLKHLGANDAICGYVLAIPVLTAAVQFLSPIILERLEWRLPLITALSAVHRIALAAMILVAALPAPDAVRLWTIGAVYFVSWLATSFSTPAVSNLYVSFVDPSARGRFFGMREMWLLVASTVMNLLMGLVLDHFEGMGREDIGYWLIYGIIFAFALLNAWAYFRMKEIPLGHNAEPLRIREIFSLPLKNGRFMKFFALSLLWNVGLQVAAAFFGVYQVSDLQLTFTQINLLVLVNAAMYFITAPIWGHLADRTSWSFTTMLSLVMLGVCHTLWFFTIRGSAAEAPLLVISNLFAGIGWAGMNVSLFNLQFDWTPEERRTVYIGFNSAASGFAGYLASLVGTMLVGAFGTWTVASPLPVGIKQVLFLASGLTLLGCALYIRVMMKPKRLGVQGMMEIGRAYAERGRRRSG